MTPDWPAICLHPLIGQRPASAEGRYVEWKIAIFDQYIALSRKRYKIFIFIVTMEDE